MIEMRRFDGSREIRRLQQHLDVAVLHQVATRDAAEPPFRVLGDRRSTFSQPSDFIGNGAGNFRGEKGNRERSACHRVTVEHGKLHKYRCGWSAPSGPLAAVATLGGANPGQTAIWDRRSQRRSGSLAAGDLEHIRSLEVIMLDLFLLKKRL
jgi:hypothetical protein